MKSITGVYSSIQKAAAAADQLEGLLSRDRINLLTPEAGVKELEAVETTADMPPAGRGMGAALGAIVAGSTALLLPGLGQITAAGIAAAALLGTGGGVAGWKIGDALDQATYHGIPVDELFVYEDALRQGKTVIIAIVDDSGEEKKVEEIFEKSGAESLDQAQKQWWLGVRDAEQAEYEGSGDFSAQESVFREGFEAALSPRVRSQEYDSATDFLKERYPADYQQAAFRRGYERGRRFYQKQQGHSSSETKQG